MIAVMTYPHPSKGYEELVCTAGITDQNEWVRLYPIDYRYRPRHQQFRKYQWIEVELEPFGHGNDRRRESRKPDLDTLTLLGEPLGADHEWRERRRIIDSMPHHTLLELKALYEQDRTSIGIVTPTRVLDVHVEESEKEWKPEWQTLFEQFRLFDTPPKPLRKLPYKWSYVFECADSAGKAHRAMIEDWELGVLFLKEAAAKGEVEAAESVRTKYRDTLCASDRDTRFFMGTVFPYNTWVVIGVFWPPRTHQAELF
jgi:hypothetical protein